MTMNIISPSQKISALYIAYFNRAPDAEGLSYWLTQASGVSAENLLRQISAGFSAHPQFQASYGALNNTQFVNALYQNMLGSAGDVSGVNYWVAKLEGGSTRADVVADFITGAMLTDLNAYRANTPGFTLADYDAALAKQNKLINKATVAVAFAEQLGAATNMGANPPADLTQSSAYQASQRILLGITDDSATANSKLTAISGLKSNANPVAAILTGATDLSAGNNPSDNSGHHVSVPTVDSVTLLKLGDSKVEALNSQQKWAASTVSYSFDAALPSDYVGESSNSTLSGNLTTGWQAFTPTLKKITVDIMTSVDELIATSFAQTSAGGDIRFNLVPTTKAAAGFAYYPGTTPLSGGDVFIDTAIDTKTLVSGGYGIKTIAHEIGHALGLKHPFEEGVTLSKSEDNRANTIMSYTDYQNVVPVFSLDSKGATVEYQSIYPDRFMVYDIAALQAIYGVDTTTRSGDDTYKYSISPFYATLWDAGGKDTLDLSATVNPNIVNMAPGSYSSINLLSVTAQAQEQKSVFHSQGQFGFDNWIDTIYSTHQTELYTGSKNLGIAYGAIIENVTGGPSSDTVYDNKVDNVIKTGGGDDTIHLGAGGYDIIEAGAGSDTVFLPIASSQASFQTLFNGLIRLTGTTFSADLYGVEKITFTDQSILLV